jgi:lipopolysaccharide transport system permease protein
MHTEIYKVIIDSFYLSIFDIKNSFKRSKIGPLWISITITIYILAIGLLFPYFFSNNIRGSLVYVGTGLVIWFYYSMTVRDCCEALTSNQSIIFSRFIDTNFYTLRIFFRHTFIFIFNLILLLLVLYFLDIRYDLFKYILTIFILILNVYLTSYIVSLICLKYRDLTQIINVSLQLGFILSPIIWNETLLGDHLWTLHYNYFYNIIAFSRNIIVNNESSLFIIYSNAIYICVLFMIYVLLYKFSSKKITNWF